MVYEPDLMLDFGQRFEKLVDLMQSSTQPFASVHVLIRNWQVHGLPNFWSRHGQNQANS